jgi:hypothetical protein
LYLPRLLNAEVFVDTVAAGCATRDGFAYAAAKDAGRWQGFAFGRSALVTLDADSLLINQASALQHQQQLDAEQQAKAAAEASLGESSTPLPAVSTTGQVRSSLPAQGVSPPVPDVPAALPQRFFGTVEVSPTTATMDFSTIVNEVIQHFAAQTGTEVTITVEIATQSNDGFDTQFQRTVKENCGVLKFRHASFE